MVAWTRVGEVAGDLLSLADTVGMGDEQREQSQMAPRHLAWALTIPSTGMGGTEEDAMGNAETPVLRSTILYQRKDRS